MQTVSDQLLTQFAWWTGNALETILLCRAFRGRFLEKYSVFYVYLAYVLAEQLVAFCVYTFTPSAYPKFYWSIQFVSITIGYCVIWEIYRQVFSYYHGAGKVARNLLAGILSFVLCRVFLSAFYHKHLGATSQNAADLGTITHIVQVSLMVTIIALVAYYGIPLGRNVKGMLFGYGMFVGLTVMQLALGSYLGRCFRSIWKHLAWVSYSAALITWSVTLWSYHPNPLPTPAVGIERDYEALSARTERLLARIRTGLGNPHFVHELFDLLRSDWPCLHCRFAVLGLP